MACPFPTASELVEKNCICQTCLCCSCDLRENCNITPVKYAKIESVLCMQIISEHVKGVVILSVPSLSQLFCESCHTFALELSSVFRVPFRFFAYIRPLIFLLMVCSLVCVSSTYDKARQPVAVQEQVRQRMLRLTETLNNNGHS